MKPLLPIRLQSWLDKVRGRGAAKARDQRDDASISNIDANATTAAADSQSAKDVAAEKQKSPAEIGGEG